VPPSKKRKIGRRAVSRPRVPSRRSAPADPMGSSMPSAPKTAGAAPQAPSPLEALRRDLERAELEVPAAALAPLLAYLDAMLEKNQHVNLTAIRDPERARVLHVLDSLHAWVAPPEEGPEPQLAIDIGSGNGFPGAALACLWPGAQVLCVDRTQKKARAIQHCLEEAAIQNAEAVAADATQLPSLRKELRRSADLVTLRAVAPLASCLELAKPFLAPAGVIAIFKASELDPQEAAEGAQAARKLHLRALEEHVYLLPGEELRARRLLRFCRR
jgi:16S rRNA (guanine527-N7)-methyltransferase